MVTLLLALWLSFPVSAPPVTSLTGVQPAWARAPFVSERVLLIGDSNFFGALGHTLRRLLRAEGHEVRLRAKPSSGLARREFFDWFDESERLIAEFHPTVIITMLGANDVQRITFSGTPRHPLFFKNEAAWRQAYFARVREFMTLLAADGRRVFYLSPTNRGWDKAATAVKKFVKFRSWPPEGWWD